VTPVLELQAVHKRYGPVRAVDGVSLAVEEGRTLGLVGESGCGKSTIARLALGLERPSDGTLAFDGRPYARKARGLRGLRRAVSMVFQDPYDSLDVRFSVREVVAEPIRAHGRWRQGGEARVRGLLESVGLGDLSPDASPAGLSGGQRQRLGVARALALEPRVVVCDEPTSSLDVSVQAQILNLLLGLQRDLGLGYLFISHDLGVVRRMSDTVAVMYAGQVVEQGPAEEVVAAPRHPYTCALLDAIPGTSPTDRRLAGRRPAPEGIASAAATGCPYATRCPRADARCRSERPELAGAPHAVACHHPEAG
jgi:oligopeptide/dipeptide ABC transporter ATP-binding protein